MTGLFSLTTKKQKKLHKFFSAIAIFSLFLQIGSGIFYARPVLSEGEAEPTPVVEQSVETPQEQPQTETSTEVTSAPENNQTPEVSPSPEPTPITETPAEVTPTPTEETAPTPIVEEDVPLAEDEAPPQETGPPQEDNQSSVSEVIIGQPEEGQLAAIILDNISAASINSMDLDLETQDIGGSATLVTDKADYAPTDTVLISGTGFNPNEIYTLIISSQDEPPVRFETQVTADENGTFVYAYQLDGNYRPNYKVEAKNSSGQIVASTTFTDSRSINSATLNGSSSVTVSPSTSISATVNVTTTGTGQDAKWQSTGWHIDTSQGSMTCENHGDHQNAGSYSETFNITSPSIAGTYNAYFIAYSDDNCSSGASSVIILTSGVVVSSATPTPTPTTPPSSVQTIENSCMADLSSHLTCTANDVSIASVSGIQILDDGCQFPGDTVTFTATWDVQSTATQRYNIGLWFATGGQTSALNGSCSISTLPNSPVPPWFDFDSNACGDISSSSQVHPEITLTVVCSDPNGDNTLNLPYCTSWEQNSSTCDGPLDTLPGAPSKCNCEDGYQIPIIVPFEANIEVIKELTPSDDPGTFNLQVDDTDEASCVGDIGTTGQVTVGAGTSTNPGATHTVGETVCEGTDLTNYNSSISCVNRGTSTFHGGVPLTQSGVGPLDVPVIEDDDIVCTITNTVNQATLTLVKTVVNDNGGDAVEDDFQAYINGNPVDWNVAQTLDADDYTVSEDPLTGYTSSAWGDDCAEDGTITLAPGDSKTCTITNDDQAATLIVKKVVINDNGGILEADDFSFQVNGGAATAFEADGQNDLTVNAGTYSVVEDPVSGYSTTYNNCSGVVIANGESATCTITNDDQPAQLTVIKNVINDNGGTAQASDFTINVTGTNVSNSSFSGAEDPGTTVTLDAGSFSVDEDFVAGYAKSFSGDCSGMIANGESKTCTIINNDVPPTLTLVKTVINDNGGDKQVADFILKIDDTQVTSGIATLLDAGIYSASEVNLPGYAPSDWGGDCTANGTITLNPGDTKVCTITNNDIAPKLTLIKNVVNDNGGNEQVSDFDLFIDGSPATSGVAYEVTANAVHTASETQLPGYTASDWGGDCAANGTITLLPGEEKTCEITNNDISPTITLIKEVINDNGGDAGPDDFGISVGGADVTSGSTTDVDANTPIAIDEVGLTGYNFVEITGDAKCPSALGDTVILNEGEHITCTIKNDDIAPTITLIKSVDNGNGGNAGVDDFGLTIGGTPVTSGQTLTVDANTSYALDEAGLAGYNFVSIGQGANDSAECPSALEGTVTLDEGENITCTIANDDVAPQLTLIKTVVTDNGGNALPDDFLLTVGGNGVLSGVKNAYQANTPLAIDETQVSGYAFVSITGDPKCPSVLGGTITLDEGDDITCTITNNDNEPSLTLIKSLTKDNGGTAIESEWTLNSNGPTGFSGTGPSVSNGASFDAGNYDLSESGGPSGYTASDWVCVGGTQVDGDTVTVALGQTVTCTITNDDVAPTLTLVKTVDNRDGGTATEFGFQAYIDSNPVVWNTPQTLLVGNHTASEVANVSGYAASDWTGDCATDGVVSLAEGENKTCYITNDDVAPTLTLVKTVVNDNGGNKVVADFPLFIGANPATSGVAYPLLANIEYIVSETNQTGYTPSIWGGDCAEDGKITLLPGDNKTCTITNGDIQPLLTVTKVVNGGDKQVSDFPLFVDQTQVTSGVQTGFNADTYTVSETNQTGYTSVITGDCASDGTITLAVGDVKSCTITNTRDTGQVSIQKNVIPHFGWNEGPEWHFDLSGDYDAGGWTLGDGHMGGLTVPTGDYTWTETAYSGVNEGEYDATYQCTDVSIPWTITGSGNSVNFTLIKDHEVGCEFTNTLRGKIIIEKQTNPDGGNQSFDFTASYDQDGFSLTDGQIDDSGSLIPGNYTATESAQLGWDLSDLNCTEDKTQNTTTDFANATANIVLDAGETVHCIFDNTQLGQITACKYDDYNGDGKKDEGEPGIMGVAMTLEKRSCGLTLVDGPNRFTNGDGEDGFCEEEWSEVDTQDTQEDGCYTFDGLKHGTYRVKENLTDPELNGYFPTDDYTTDGDYRVSGEIIITSAGASIVGFFNRVEKIALTLDKTHDKMGTTASRGDILNFTLTVSNTGKGTAYNVTVQDSLPDGFSYVAGSSKVEGVASEPTPDGNKLTWNVGEIAGGSSKTITYQVKISDSIAEGSHANVAVAFGFNRKEDKVYSNFDYVYTAVGIGISYSVSVGGAVLGAATGQVLGAATGSPTMLLITAILMILAGLIVLLKKGKKSHV